MLFYLGDPADLMLMCFQTPLLRSAASLLENDLSLTVFLNP